MKKTRFLRQMVMMIALCMIMTTFLGLVPVSAVTVKMNKAKATMEVDSVLTLALVGAEGSTAWKSSNSAIASVSKKGKVTAVGEGVATITATNKGNKYSCSVNVVDSNKGNKPAKASFNASDVVKKIKKTGEYRYSDSLGWYHYLFIVAKNTSDYTVKLTGKVKFYDENKEILGYSSSTEYAVGAGEEICLKYSNEDPFDSYELEWVVSEQKNYSAVCNDISLNVTTVKGSSSFSKGKVVIEATNNGIITAEYVEYYALFFEGEKLVGYDRGYVDDDDSELKPGMSETREATSYVEFDSVKVYISGRGDK